MKANNPNGKYQLVMKQKSMKFISVYQSGHESVLEEHGPPKAVNIVDHCIKIHGGNAFRKFKNILIKNHIFERDF